jgi:mannose-6-phosphate isomerase-like protein (cupin superfamily)
LRLGCKKLFPTFFAVRLPNTAQRNCGTEALSYFEGKEKTMQPAKNISVAADWFQTLQTTARTQTAIMRLEPGKASGPKPDRHKNSDQVLLVLEGVIEGEIEGKSLELRKGDCIIIPAGTLHRFENKSKTAALTFNTYSPPAY